MVLPDKLLVANRGEIALRIIKSATQLGIKTVAIYTESEKGAGYVALADEKISLGEDDLNATFLNIDKIIGIAVSTGSDAIHPGYGFLSENPDFALACKENQIIFVGPEQDVLSLMGNKPAAKKLAESLGIPLVASYKIDQGSDLLGITIEFPVLIKASFGGGGKGMKLVNNREELIHQVYRSTRMAQEYFGNGELFLEPYIRNARHVEVQILGDKFGNVIHLYERECSIQRNHQKIVEEAPAIFLSLELRQKLLSSAIKIGKSVDYTGAGTVEFLVDETGNYFFMEMNPRIQVEHAVTEQITGIDIVSEQIKVASGFPLSFSQEQVIVSGHAIEIRVYAENPAKNFRPSAEPLVSINLPPYHQDIRIEADLQNKHQTGNSYDPLLLKLIASGKDRESSIQLLRDNIQELNIIGPDNNVKYLEQILAHDYFQQNKISVEFCETYHEELINYANREIDPGKLPYLIGFVIFKSYLESDNEEIADVWKSTGYWRLSPTVIPIAIDGKIYKVNLTGRDKSKTSFLLDGIVTEFKAERKSDKCIFLTINSISRQLYNCLTDQGEIRISLENIQYRLTLPGLLKSYPETVGRTENGKMGESGDIISPLYGKILELFIKENQLIKVGDPLLVIESMKSENHIHSHRDARVKKIAIKVGAQVTDRMPLIYLED